MSGGEAVPIDERTIGPEIATESMSSAPATPGGAEEGIYVTETGSPDVTALFDSPVPEEDVGPPSLHGAPSRLQVLVSSDVVILGASHLQTAIRGASSIGTYMPVAVGEHADVWLYDSGATISQASPAAIKQMRPFLTELDTGNVDFISVENKFQVSMRLFRSNRTSLIQVESGVRSRPEVTMIIENPMLRSFPLLLGLQTMSDLNLSTCHRMAIVRDEEGRAFRLYPKVAIPKLLPSLAILSRTWQSETRSRSQRSSAGMVGKGMPGLIRQVSQHKASVANPTQPCRPMKKGPGQTARRSEDPAGWMKPNNPGRQASSSRVKIRQKSISDREWKDPKDDQNSTKKRCILVTF